MMFSNNGKISERQVIRMLIIDLFTSASLFLPMALPRVSGKGGVFALILGLALTWGQERIISTNRMIWSKQWMRKMIGVRCFLSYIFGFGLYMSVLGETFLYTMSKVWILGAMLGVLFYASAKGIEVRARLSELLFYAVLLPVFVLGVFSMPQAQWTNLLMADGMTFKGIVQGALVTWVLMSPMEWFVCVDFKLEDGDRKHIYDRAFWMGGSFILIIYLLCVVVLDIDGMGMERWPTHILMQIVKLPGGFMSRQDGLMLSFWIFAMFLSLFGAVSHSFEFFFGKEQRIGRIKQNLWILIGGVMAYFTGMSQRFLEVYFTAMIGSGIFLFFVLPWILGNRRRLVYLLVCLCFVNFTGCQRYIELENRDFVMAIGVDLGEKKTYQLTFAFQDLDELTDHGDGEKSIPITMEVESLKEAEELYNSMSENLMDFGQVKVIVFGEDIGKYRMDVDDLNNEIKNKPEMARTIYVCKCRGTARKIIHMDEKMNTSVGVYLEELLNNQNKAVLVNQFLKKPYVSGLPEVGIYEGRLRLY